MRCGYIKEANITSSNNFKKMDINHSIILLIIVFIGSSISQHFYDCPLEWQVSEDRCYHFVYFPVANYESARSSCSIDGAALVSVNSFTEHSFVTDWLLQHDPYQRSWFTSGLRKFSGSPNFVWKGDGTEIKPNAQFWLPGQPANDTDGKIITYKYGVTGYEWEMASADEQLPYICEIKQAEAYRIVQHNRDFDYGLKIVDPNNLPKGPIFTKQPSSVVIVSRVLGGVIECVASGNPLIKYKWFRITRFKRDEITSVTDDRYTLSNGKLTIQDPSEDLDAGDYQCEASNKFGTILSNIVVISFGRISEFSNLGDDSVRANAYEGVAIQCSKINAKPAVKFQWMKTNTNSFVRPQLQHYIFISANGKLYFSEVTRVDSGDYKCFATLSGLNKHAIGTTQPPTRTSLPIQLIVNDQAAKADWGPEIQNDFIAVFPQSPLRGNDVRLECFAYGSSTTQFTYTWHRESKPMPRSSKSLDHNRILIITDAQLEDQGTYTCVVSRGQAASDRKSLTLRLGAEPYFIAQLQNQHIDIGSQLTWRCEARANPPATYNWYKNGKPLLPVPGEMTIHGNVLTIESVNPKKHDGMYQCGAENTHGTTFSSAQLRVLSFKPNFFRNPMSKVFDGAIDGNITLMCKPEGAPTPEISWYRNGAQLSVGNGHYEQLSNGYLLISGLQFSDEAEYRCKAVNEVGEATDTTRVQVTSGTKITVAPSPTRVIVNSTAFLYCEASYDPNIDMVYIWKFNGHLLRNGYDPHIVMESGRQRNGLYIMSAQPRHAGVYECHSVTPLDSDTRSGYLTISGPPGEPVGVYVDDEVLQDYKAHIRWTVGASNGRPISYYIVEYKTEFNPEWKVTISNILDEKTLVASENKRMVEVSGLSPGTSYYFRLKAVNDFGTGPPSLPSAAISTPHAPPIRSVDNVRGGGGSVGDLTIRWDPLPRDDHGGNGIGYKVYWRKLIDKTGSWRQSLVHYNRDQFVHTVGHANYFLEYQVMIEAFNNEGSGPNSTIEVVYSADDMPSLTPTNVQSDTYNGTALEVSWEPIEDKRETAKGKILGYQINYWPDEGDYWLMFIRHAGQRDTGLVIGLVSDTNFWVDVQMYNSAGLGPRSEAFFMETSRLPTDSYPEEVRVFSDSADSCRIWFRGITTTVDEALITGYRIYFWQARESFMTARTFDTEDQKDTDVILKDLEKDIVYALRVGGISAAGEGKKSPTIYFTLGGKLQLEQLMAKSIQGFLAAGSVITSSIYLLTSSLLCIMVLSF